ncbi:MAG: molybdopterin-guanine dinucleotide biosynthesis protein B [Rhodospirillaceae bacterium]|nr:molybdopterin-guanine dinucleotide biosynthesis protein B [Rhodospirillaceae bacterium]MBT7510797.1 molybdopterin-guanine dinucleotide biosynthesis protein B [Rhodospirillaceae bacterium]
MNIFGLVGWSGSGKTTLMRLLLPELTSRGYRVSTMKHTHHNFDIDKPGKDSYMHREAGAHEVLITGAKRWAILHENRHAPEPDIETLLTRLEEVDLVLIEGFKSHSHAKMEVFRPSVGKSMIAADDKTIVAIASDEQLNVENCPILDLNDIVGIADFILNYCGLNRRAANGAA